MNYLRNLGIRWKLVIPLVVIVILVFVLSGRSYYSESMQANAISQVTHNEIPTLNYVQQAYREFYQAWVAERSILTLPVKSEQYQLMRKMHEESIENVQQLMRKVEEYPQPDEIRQLIGRFWETFPKWKAVSQRIERERSSNTRAGRSAAIGLSYKDAFDLFRQTQHHLEQITEMVVHSGDQRAAELEEMHEQYKIEQLSIISIFCVICLCIIWFFPLLITGHMQQITRQIQILAQGGGDLTRRLALGRRDELGLLGSSLDQFMDELHHLVKQIIDNATQNHTHVSTLGTMSRKACQMAQEQVDSMQKAAASSQDMNNAIHSVAQRTHDAASITSQAKQSADEGRQQVAETQHHIQRLNESMEHAATAISRIEDVTDKISSVLTIISGIAEQTNLLALNAAIEAARAGDKGRGFAVVADEVRGLANKTQHCTQDVNEMIARLEKSVQDAVKVMRQASEQSLATKESSEVTRHTIDEMMTAIDNVTDTTSQIATVIEEQSQVAADIQTTIKNVEALSRESVEQASEVDTACQILDELHQQLSTVTGKFKV
jgi:methyl-accepting chemotaxis protein